MARDIPQHTKPPTAAKHKRRARQEDRGRSSARQRGYTSTWDKFSRSFLRANPLCEFCQADGRVTAARVTDHDIPHEGDSELFWNNTFTALCFQCHNSTKQRMEAVHTGDGLLNAIADIKAGLPPSRKRRERVDVVRSAGAILVWGPPAAGKTTWATAEASRTGAVLYDLDEIAEARGLPRYGRTRAQASRAMDEMFAMLGRHPQERRLILINSGAGMRRRGFWASLIEANEARLITAPMRTCIDRVMGDPARRRHAAQQVAAIRSWFDIVEAGL